MAKIRFVPVGDSYTKGEGATKEESWPVLLVRDLQAKGRDIEMVANPARTGWLTHHVLELELPIFESHEPNFATLLIGANDWVQEVPRETFEKNLREIVERMQNKLPDPTKMVLLTIPDFAVTPTGQIFSEGRDVTGGIGEFNQIIFKTAAEKGLGVVDIYPLSQGMKNNPELVALDGLHPSAKEYVLWEKEILPVVAKLLG